MIVRLYTSLKDTLHEILVCYLRLPVLNVEEQDRKNLLLLNVYLHLQLQLSKATLFLLRWIPYYYFPRTPLSFPQTPDFFKFYLIQIRFPDYSVFQQ